MKKIIGRYINNISNISLLENMILFLAPRPPPPPLTVILRRRRTVGRVRAQMVPRVRVLVHRREGVRAERAPRAGEAPVVRPRRPPVRVRRPRVEVVLVRRPQRAVPVLLQLDEGALRDGRRVRGLVGRRRPDVRLPRHRGGAGRLLVRPPERGTQVREVQRREGFVVHFGRGAAASRGGRGLTDTSAQPRT